MHFIQCQLIGHVFIIQRSTQVAFNDLINSYHHYVRYYNIMLSVLHPELFYHLYFNTATTPSTLLKNRRRQIGANQSSRLNS